MKQIRSRSAEDREYSIEVVGQSGTRGDKEHARRLLFAGITGLKLKQRSEGLVYDGVRMLLSNEYLKPDEYSYNPLDRFSNDEIETLHLRDATKIKFELVFTEKTTMHTLLEGTERKERGFEQTFEVLLTGSATESGVFFPIPPKLYMEGDDGVDYTLNLGSAHELRYGVHKSVYVFPNGPTRQNIPYLCLDSTKAIFWKSQVLVDTVAALLGQPVMNVRWDKETRIKLARKLKGVKVQHMVTGQEFTVDSFTDQPVSQLFADWIEDENGQSPLFCDVFQQLQLRNWPAFVSKNRRQLPMEHYYIAPHQKLSKAKQWTKLQSQCESALQKSRANERRNDIIFYWDQLLNSEIAKITLKAFGLEVSENPLSVQPQTLNFPQIVYGKGSKTNVGDKGDWRLDKNVAFFRSAKVDHVHVFYGTEGFKSSLRAFIDKIHETAQNHGIQINPKEFTASFCALNRMEAEFEKYSKLAVGKNVLFFYIDDKDVDSHRLLKYVATKYRVAVKHVTTEVASLTNRSNTFDNIVKDLNAKLGALNHALKSPSDRVQSILDGALHVGYDVSHSGYDLNAPAVIGFSSNVGTERQQFVGDFHFQTTHKNDHVEEPVLIRRFVFYLNEFRRLRGDFPKRLIVHRDMLSQGAHNDMLQRELGAIREACKRVQTKPLISFIVCSTGHNLRIFENQEGRINNSPAGSLLMLDSGEENYRFMLQSQSAIQGTPKAAVYTVLHHEGATEQNRADLRQLLHDLANLHPEANRAIARLYPLHQADEFSKRGTAVYEHLVDSDGNIPKLRLDGGREVPDWGELTRQLSVHGRLLEDF